MAELAATLSNGSVPAGAPPPVALTAITSSPYPAGKTSRATSSPGTGVGCASIGPGDATVARLGHDQDAGLADRTDGGFERVVGCHRQRHVGDPDALLPGVLRDPAQAGGHATTSVSSSPSEASSSRVS